MATDTLLSLGREAWTTTQNMEFTLQRLRSSGASKLECIKIIREVCNVSLGDAKQAVHFSQAWSDQREASEALQDAVISSLSLPSNAKAT